MTQGVVMERQTEWIYRPGFGWVERPVEQPVEDEQTEDEAVAVAA